MQAARGLILKGKSAQNTFELCSNALQRLTRDAGVGLTMPAMAIMCKLNARWVNRFRGMKAVHVFGNNNKHFPDRHEFHVTRGLTARPMEVLVGDVHTVDLTIADALSSTSKAARSAGRRAIVKGETTVKAWLIAWMDGSSGTIWATPVIPGPGQGIRQQDVARSLYDMLTCPWGGMPETFLLDNGGDYSFLAGSVIRFAAMADMAGLSVIKCRPYHPEGKARLEGAFGVIERGFIKVLPGYSGGNHLNPRLQARGKPVAPHDRGPGHLIEDLHLAVAQDKGRRRPGN